MTSILAIETTGAIARHTGATVHAAYVIDPATSDEVRQQGKSMLADRTASLGQVTVETTILESDDVVSALVEERGAHDLTIIGATREGVIQQFVFGTIPETVVERAPTTVIMTKQSVDIRTRLQQSLDKLRKRVTDTANAIEQEDTGSGSRD